MTKLFTLLAVVILSVAIATRVNANDGLKWDENELRFLDLIAAAEAGADVSETFIRNYSKRTVLILTPYLKKAVESDLLTVDQDEIRIQDFDIATKVLKLFGKHISKLLLRQFSDRRADFNVTDLINIHCTDSVTELTLHVTEPYKEFFGGLAPFKKLETLKLNGHYQSLDSPTHKFDERFPALKHLFFAPRSNVTDEQSFDRELNHLQQLDLFIAFEDQKMTENLKKLITKNPRVKNVNLLHCEREFVKFISENLRQLDELRLIWRDETDITGLEDVHFDSVKTLSIDSAELYSITSKSPIRAPKNISYNNIESLDAYSFEKNPKSWVDLVASSIKLKQLGIEKDLNEDVLKQLSPLVPGLTNFNARLIYDVKDQTMLNFLKSHRALLKVHWKRYSGFRTLAELIRKEIGYAWKITETTSDITLERQF